MSEPTVTVTAIPPISEWNPALQAIVRCLEAMEATKSSCSNRCNALVESVESFVTAQGQNELFPWGVAGLAELALYEPNGRPLIPRKRGLRYLIKAAEEGYLNAQLALVRLAEQKEIPPPGDMDRGWFNADEVWNGIQTEYTEMGYDKPYILATCEKSQMRWDEFNHEQVEYWWKQAAKNGSADAQYRMSDGLIDSDDPEEFAEGVKWLAKAARQKTPNVNAQHEL